jgi:hypothetical protein
MIVIASDLTITPTADINANNPVIGWQNVLLPSSIAASSTLSGYPASNLANPSTASRWQAAATATGTGVTLTATLLNPTVDYVAVARHNFGTAAPSIIVEGVLTSASPGTWITLVQATTLPDDAPVIFRFVPRQLQSLRLRIIGGSVAPRAAVLYIGALLIVQRRLYVGHTPMQLSRNVSVVNARSESGNFLGRIITGESTDTKVDLQNLKPDWYRTNMAPFIVAAREAPFFFAWRPGNYPLEVGYAWLTNDPKPSNARTNGMMSVALQLGGTVL